jgi:hypothetical protein
VLRRYLIIETQTKTASSSRVHNVEKCQGHDWMHNQLGTNPIASSFNPDSLSAWTPNRVRSSDLLALSARARTLILAFFNVFWSIVILSFDRRAPQFPCSKNSWNPNGALTMDGIRFKESWPSLCAYCRGLSSGAFEVEFCTWNGAELRFSRRAREPRDSLAARIALGSCLKRALTVVNDGLNPTRLLQGFGVNRSIRIRRGQ